MCETYENVKQTCMGQEAGVGAGVGAPGVGGRARPPWGGGGVRAGGVSPFGGRREMRPHGGPVRGKGALPSDRLPTVSTTSNELVDDL